MAQSLEVTEGNGYFMDILKLQQQMEKILKPKRYLHVLGVQFTSASLAMRYGADIEKAQLAGLLHDCAKPLSDEALISECIKYQVEIRDIEKESPYLLHSKLGAVYAKEKYGITDEEIHNSIIYHTTGSPNMGLLDKIVFVADLIEPSRLEEHISKLPYFRSLAFQDIDLAIYEITKHTLEYLKKSGKKIDTMTVDTYDFYRKLIETR